MSSPSTQSVPARNAWNVYDDPLYRVIAGFNLFLKALFKDMNPGEYKWIDDPKLTEIFITDQHPVNLEVVEKRPAIVTIRGNAQWANLGMNQTVDYEWHSGKVTKQDLVSFHVTFACLSREGVEAQRLAWFLFSMLPLFKPHLQRSIHGLHNIGNSLSMGGETPAGALVQGSSTPEWKMVQVVAPIHVSYKSSIEPLDKVWLEGIVATIQNQELTINQSVSID